MYRLKEFLYSLSWHTRSVHEAGVDYIGPLDCEEVEEVIPEKLNWKFDSN